MKLTEFNYELPEKLIAQVPIEKRDESRLMVLDREKQTIEHKVFKDIIDYVGFQMNIKQNEREINEKTKEILDNQEG